MRDIPEGMLAGVGATTVPALWMALKASSRFLLQLEFPNLLAESNESPDTPATGSNLQFSGGVVAYGVAIAAIHSKLPGTSPVGRGPILVFGDWTQHA